MALQVKSQVQLYMVSSTCLTDVPLTTWFQAYSQGQAQGAPPRSSPKMLAGMTRPSCITHTQDPCSTAVGMLGTRLDTSCKSSANGQGQ